MMRDAKRKKFNILICYRLDRISRNVSDFTQTIEELKRTNIQFISIREQFDTSSPMGRAMMNIAAVFAQLERETIAERVKDNMQELAKTGRWLGGTAPLGYSSEPIKYSDTNGKDKTMYKLTVLDDEIKIVKLIFDLYLEKKNYSSVANFLCRNYYKGKNNGEFSRKTVQQIITNPVYCIADAKAFKYFNSLGVGGIYGESSNVNGFMVYNKRIGGKKDRPIQEWIFSIGQHLGVIDSETWIQCQNINKIKSEKSTSQRLGTGSKFLLASMITCGCCGSGMASWSHYLKKYDRMERYYRCNLKNRAANRCPGKMLNAYKAEELLIEKIKNINIETLIKGYKEVTSSIDTINNSAKEIDIYQNEINTNNKTIQGLIRKLAIEEDESYISMYKAEISKIRLEINELEKKINDISKNLVITNENKISVDEIINRLNNFKNTIDYATDFEDRRELILSIVESIVWHGTDEKLEVNIIGSGKTPPRGLVLARNLCYGDSSR